jgi:hypothetical protein
MKRYIILDSIEGEPWHPGKISSCESALREVRRMRLRFPETTRLWEDRGFVNLTGAKSQWSLNTLEKDENDPDNAAAKDIPFGPDTVGTAETGQTQVSPAIMILPGIGDVPLTTVEVA